MKLPPNEDQTYQLVKNHTTLKPIINNIIFDLIKSPRYQVINKRKMSSIFLDQHNNKVDLSEITTKGVYHIMVGNTDFYTGHAGVNISTRVNRMVKQALGENTEDENHTAGQWLYDNFTKYGRKDIWIDSIYVKYLSLSQIKKYFTNISVKHFTLYGDEHYPIQEFDDKVILQFVEKCAIQTFESPLNKIYLTPGDRFIKNWSVLHMLRKKVSENPVNVMTDYDRMMKGNKIIND
tara:strand:+ start:56 stop:760 length:705 start_codon:yes stop_codon:yes gene_type:complete